MLTLFRTNQLLIGVLLLPYLILLRVDWFWRELAAIAPQPGIGNAWLVPWLNQHSNAQFWGFLLLVFMQALLANSIAFQHRLAPAVSLFPGVFVCLLSSLLPEFGVYSGYLVANIFLLLAIQSLLSAFRKLSAAIPIFNAGVWLGVATFFVPSYCWLFIPFGITLTILKSGKFRDQYILLFGITLPHYLFAIYYFWDDRLSYFWTSQWSDVFSWPTLMTLEWEMLPGLVLLAILLALVLLNANRYKSKMKMEAQTKIDVLYWVLLGTGLTGIFNMPWMMNKWLAMAPIAGLLLSLSFIRMRTTTAEAWHLLLLVALGGLNWWQFFSG